MITPPHQRVWSLYKMWPWTVVYIAVVVTLILVLNIVEALQ